MSHSAESHHPFGVLAEFESPQIIYGACEKVRDAGYQIWDSHTPYPVHGLDKAMGLKSSKLPWVVLFMGLLGAGGGLLLQWWVSTTAYPLVIGGKPFFSWQAFVPVCFELMVLFAALGSVVGMLHFNRLPQLYHATFRSKRFERVTDDRFFISIEATDPKFDQEETIELLQSAGASHVEILEQ